MMISPSDLSAKIGRSLLFIGSECAHWTIADFVQAAKSAKALGFDAIVPKRFDGIYRWYSSVAQLQAERDAVEAEGVKFVPFGYCYGPAFGASQIAQECALLAELQSVCHGVAVADLEKEWNAHPDAAKSFVAEMQKHPANILILSTWADPVQQQWQEDIKTLESIVASWWPQQYDNWLAAQTPQFTSLGAMPIQPTIDIRNDNGPNDPLTIVKNALATGCQSVSVWEYQYALANPDLTKAITALLPQEEPMKQISLSDAAVAQHFSQAPGNAWQCTAQGHQYIVGNAMLDFYRKYNGSDASSYCGLTYLGLPDSSETPIPNIPGATIQRFERGILAWDEKHQNDAPPGAGPVYVVQLYNNGVGTDPRLIAAQQQLVTLEQQLANSQKGDAALSTVQQIKTLVSNF